MVRSQIDRSNRIFIFVVFKKDTCMALAPLYKRSNDCVHFFNSWKISWRNPWTTEWRGVPFRMTPRKDNSANSIHPSRGTSRRSTWWRGNQWRLLGPATTTIIAAMKVYFYCGPAQSTTDRCSLSSQSDRSYFVDLFALFLLASAGKARQQKTTAL